MGNNHKKKRKPAGDDEIPPQVRRKILHQKKEGGQPGVSETRQIRHPRADTEVPEIAEKKETESENHIPAKPTVSQKGAGLEVRSAIKSSIKGALYPPPSAFQKPASRAVILPSPALPEEPEPGEVADAEDMQDTQKTKELLPPSPAQDSLKTTDMPDTGRENPPFCKNCGKKVPPAGNFCPACGSKIQDFSPPRG
jgi:hypothetical protein